jgi:SAM-dependent methyltransferase
VIHAWKVTNLLKGALTWVPAINNWRRRRASTLGSDSSRYCYSAWMRHLVTLDRYGFTIKGAKIGELGPGDSIGMGLASLLSGASQYVGLDIFPFSAKANLKTIFEELVQLYATKESIPDQNEFPLIRPRLNSYEFPEHLIETESLRSKILAIGGEINKNISHGTLVTYQAPWNSRNATVENSLDLVFSQAVLEHVDNLIETYRAMFAWLKPGGYASHVIDFRSHQLSPFWNGHWAYSDWEWWVVRGRREFLLNRQPLSMHLDCAKKTGFEILSLQCNQTDGGLAKNALSRRYRLLDDRDLETSGSVLILRKPF